MTAKDIFMKTLPFCWSKLGLGLLNIVICVVLFAILMGIALLFNSEGVAAVMIIVWLRMPKMPASRRKVQKFDRFR